MLAKSPSGRDDAGKGFVSDNDGHDAVDPLDALQGSALRGQAASGQGDWVAGGPLGEFGLGGIVLLAFAGRNLRAGSAIDILDAYQGCRGQVPVDLAQASPHAGGV